MHDARETRRLRSKIANATRYGRADDADRARTTLAVVKAIEALAAVDTAPCPPTNDQRRALRDALRSIGDRS